MRSPAGSGEGEIGRDVTFLLAASGHGDPIELRRRSLDPVEIDRPGFLSPEIEFVPSGPSVGAIGAREVERASTL